MLSLSTMMFFVAVREQTDDTFQTWMHCIFRRVAHRVYPSVYTDNSHHQHHRVCPAHQVDFIFLTAHSKF